jgi:hypothetical protein
MESLLVAPPHKAMQSIHQRNLSRGRKMAQGTGFSFQPKLPCPSIPGNDNLVITRDHIQCSTSSSGTLNYIPLMGFATSTFISVIRNRGFGKSPGT